MCFGRTIDLERRGRLDGDGTVGSTGEGGNDGGSSTAEFEEMELQFTLPPPENPGHFHHHHHHYHGHPKLIKYYRETVRVY